MANEKYILQESIDDHLTFGQIAGGIRDRIRLILSLGVFGLVVSAALMFIKADFYESKAVFASSLFTANEIEPVVTSLQETINDNSSQKVQKVLGLTEEQVASIIEVDYVNLEQQGVEGAYIFAIELVCEDSSFIPEIHQSIKTYIESNDYLSREYNRRRAEMESLITSSEGRIKEMYEIKDAPEEGDESGAFYQVSIHQQIVDMEERLLMYKEDYAKINIASYLQAPTVPDRPAGPNRIMIILISMMLGVSVGVIISIAELLY